MEYFWPWLPRPRLRGGGERKEGVGGKRQFRVLVSLRFGYFLALLVTKCKMMCTKVAKEERGEA